MANERNPGEVPPFLYGQYNGPWKYNQYFYVRMGRIEYVDPEKYTLDVIWQDGGARDQIPISFAYASPAGCLGALPERGSMGIFGFFNEGTGKGSPLLLTYLPAGLNAGLNFADVKVLPDALSTDDVNQISFRFRKIGQGDMIAASPLGSMLLLNKNLEFRDLMGDTILLREDDQSILSTSIHNFIFTDGAAIYMGPALRNGLPIYDISTGKKLDNNGSLVSFLDRDNVYLTSQGKDVQYGTPCYTEYRIDASELSDGKLDYNDINSSTPTSTRDSIVSFVLGNYIGADRKNPQTYGNILKARIFKTVDDRAGSLSLERANQRNGKDEPATIGLAYALHFLKSNCFLGVDKEGHYYVSLPASSSINPLGAGRSMSLAGAGNLKETWGPDVINGNAWDLITKGGIRWDIGNHNNNYKSRSIQITTSRGYYLEVKNSDDDGNGKVETIQGNIQESSSGDRNVSCASLNYKINGLKTETVTESSSESVTGDKSVNVLKDSSETVAGEKKCQFGSRKTTIKGNDSLTVIQGNITETIQIYGNKKTSVNLGNIEQNITLVGSATAVSSTTLSPTSYKVNVKAGTIDIKTSAGLVTVGGTSVSIKGLLVNIDSPVVRVGKGALIGGVVSGLPGKPTHFDYLTGLPLVGSMKVSVG